MKQLLALVSLFVVLTGCSKYKEQSRLISDFVQTNENVKLDLDFKMLELSELDTSILAIDSLEYFLLNYDLIERNEPLRNRKVNKECLDSLNSRLSEDIEELEGLIARKQKSSDSLESLLPRLIKEWDDIYNNGSILSRDMENKNNQVIGVRDELQRLKMDISGSEIYKHDKEKISRIIDKYSSDLERVLARVFEARYKMKNPLLNNIEMETKEIFLFNSHGNRILDNLTLKQFSIN